MRQKTMLIVLDGWGIAPEPSVSAVDQAHTPFIDSLYPQYPHSRLRTSGKDVGLPAGQMGNSEVGHMNLGAGRVVYQDLERINLAVADQSLFAQKAWKDAVAKAREEGRSLHLMGLVSDGGVHAHHHHLMGLLSACQREGLSRVFVHAFTDGRDTDPHSGLRYVEEVEKHCEKTTGRIATVIGRYYAMDRDQRWERTARAHHLLTRGEGKEHPSASSAIQAAYQEGESDEFITPRLIHREGLIREKDVVLCFNFRTDRARQLTEALARKSFAEEGMQPLALHYLTMTRYDERFTEIPVLLEKDNLRQTLGEVLAAAGKKQLRIAETEKYPHVTFFFNGGREEAFPGEERIMCPSPKVATYDLQPEMSAYQVRDTLLPVLQKGEVDFVCLNFANPDMVGHTGVFAAAVKACETVDACTRAVVEAALESDYHIIIIADHGNAEQMKNPDGSPHTAHTTNPVPCILVSRQHRGPIRDGRLADIAPTLLHMMQVKPPREMTGENLLA